MADPRSRRPGAAVEPNMQIAKLIADASAMREQIERLEARVARLEAEFASASGKPSTLAASKRPPPLPKMAPAMPALPKQGARRSVVDISEIAELVESIPPPPPTGPAPPRPRKRE